ncbi:type IV pilus modification protein PilV [Massilia sp. R2A-15]|uniref:type IV pilus modification protein PilV n=1 Tax=Massilia sp. R2A-15 TaxID=3064278 RepID=UPI002733A619|nr:type IV pilus modification protein PilV [Massilia sp. R2A-15]WLI90373.1 type IV pilus modification protein PilV [Massilia sp. R2A-15]
MRSRLAGGFTLIEVLVALCVLTIGALGAAAMQLSALRARHQSGLASSAVQLAGSLADSMRANRVAMQAGDALNPYLQLRYDAQTDGPPQPPGALCHAGAPCTALQLAEAEAYHIKDALRTQYPGGRVVVCRDSAAELNWACDGAAGAPVVIKIGWRGQEAGAAAQPRVALALPGAAG